MTDTRTVLRLNGFETDEEIRRYETDGADVDRFGRSRDVMYTYGWHCKHANDMEEFLMWFKAFIRYTGQVRTPSITGNARNDRAIMAAFGMAGEGGEVIDIFKKVFVHDKKNLDTMSPARREKLVEEMGDRLWYDFNLLDLLGLDIRDVMLGCVTKLTHDLRTH